MLCDRAGGVGGLAGNLTEALEDGVGGNRGGGGGGFGL